MKSLKIIIAAVSISLLSTFSVNATEKNPSKINKEVRTTIISILGSELPLQIKKESTADISFITNGKNEIVILTVDSKNENISSYIKRKLNYQKLNVLGLQRGEKFALTIKIKVKN